MHDIVIIIDRFNALKGANNVAGDLASLQVQAVDADAWLANPPKDATETQIDATHEWLETIENALGEMVGQVATLAAACPI